MPKDMKNTSSKLSDLSRSHPYSRKPEQENVETPLEVDENEWKEITCPACMEPPHNPVLLLCTSHIKGCRPYMCHTSPLLSNCLAQYRICSSSSEGLLCPLSRGKIVGEILATRALRYMNSRPRDCSQEDCLFRGTYSELMDHARKNHIGRRTARMRVGHYPRCQIARRDVFPPGLATN